MAITEFPVNMTREHLQLTIRAVRAEIAKCKADLKHETKPAIIDVTRELLTQYEAVLQRLERYARR